MRAKSAVVRNMRALSLIFDNNLPNVSGISRPGNSNFIEQEPHEGTSLVGQNE